MKKIRLACHVHTEWSDDADWNLKRLARVLRAAGFHGALLCDHDRTMTEDRRRKQVAACRTASTSQFLFVPGVEYQDPDHVVHMPVYGDIPFFSRSPNMGELLAYAAEAGGAAVFAHPGRRDAHTRFDEAWVPHLSGIEVWNRKYDGITPNRWAIDTANSTGLPGFTALDFHGPRQIYPLAMTLHIAGPTSPSQIIDSLRAGDCHPSAFGLAPEAYASGRLGTAVDGLENTRRRLAPYIRRAEARVRR